MCNFVEFADSRVFSRLYLYEPVFDVSNSDS